MKGITRLSVSVLLLLHIFGVPVHPNIVDTMMAIVIESDGTGVDAKDNLFGYSLAFMKGFFGEASAGDASKRMGTLFIGAPNETRLTDKYGTVWQCRFDGSETPQPLCSILYGISRRKSYNPHPITPEATTSRDLGERAANQWIGASLSAAVEQLYVGAPRWVEPRAFEDTMKGGCYVLSSPNSAHDLRPLEHKDETFHDLSIRGSAQDQIRVWFRYAEFGFSVHTNPAGFLLVGAPGSRNSRGAIVVMRRNHQNPDFIYNEKGDISRVTGNSYLGYSITSGRIPQPQRYKYNYIASGAPRGANLRGIVTVMLPTSGYWVTHIYEGEKMGSYFGYALATVDLNDDGHDELLVGAPFYTLDPLSPTGQSVGCVFVFDIARLPNTQPMVRLCPNEDNSPLHVTMGARFGSAISNLGDINNDHRDDFAVSAPYDEEGVGTLFIYHGGLSYSHSPSQIIRGKSLGIPHLRGLGTYLLGGSHVDVDGNGTPDLVVGAFESRHVVAFRTRPAAKAVINITFYDADFRGKIVKLSPNQDKFGVRVCVHFQLSVPLPKEIQLKTWMKFEADPKEKRMKIISSGAGSESRSEISSRKGKCFDNLLQVDRTEAQRKSDIPLEFHASLQYNETKLTVGQVATPVVTLLSGSNQRPPVKQPLPFNSYFPVPFDAMSHAEIVTDNCDADGRPECDPRLKMKLDLFFINSDAKDQQQWSEGQTLVVGQLQSLVISLVLSNEKETAYLPTVQVTFRVASTNLEVSLPYLTVDWVDTPGVTGDCVSTSNSGNEIYDGRKVERLRCRKSLHAGDTLKYLLRITNLTSLLVKAENSKGQLALNVDAFPSVSERHHKVSHNVTLPLVGSIKLSVKTGDSETGRSGIDPKKGSHVDLTQVYIVKNSGFSATAGGTVTAKLLIPSHAIITNNNKTEVTQLIGVTDPSNTVFRCQAVNFPFLTLSTQGGLTANNSIVAPGVTTPEAGATMGTPASLKQLPHHPVKSILSESSDQFITFSGCDTPEQIQQFCQNIICEMDLPSQGLREIKIQLYLLPAAIKNLVKEATKGVRVQTIVSVSYPGIEYPVSRKGSVERTFTAVVRAPLWIYCVSVGGGIILFILMTLAMFKCGFFRRKKKESLIRLKRLTQQRVNVNAWSFLDEAPGGVDGMPDRTQRTWK